MSEAVAVRILDKEYLVACPAEERPALLAAARLLDERLRGMRQGNKLESLERLAVLAALNFAHERMRTEAQAQLRDSEIERSLDEMNRRIDLGLDALRPAG